MLLQVYNRRVIDKVVRRAVGPFKTMGLDIALGIVDVDDFKSINDTFGHAEGDKVLVGISDMLKGQINKIPSSVIGRWGGEEFFFMLPKVSIDEAYKLLDEIRQKISDTKYDEVGSRTISVGITEYQEGDTADDVFQRADEALYEAKGSGKNKICIK